MCHTHVKINDLLLLTTILVIIKFTLSSLDLTLFSALFFLTILYPNQKVKIGVPRIFHNHLFVHYGPCCVIYDYSFLRTYNIVEEMNFRNYVALLLYSIVTVRIQIIETTSRYIQGGWSRIFNKNWKFTDCFFLS